MNKKKFMTTAMVCTLALTFGVGSALAATKTRAPKRDGSCPSSYTTEVDDLTMAASKKKDRKRLKSCQNYVPAEDGAMNLAAADRKQSRTKSASCRS